MGGRAEPAGKIYVTRTARTRSRQRFRPQAAGTLRDLGRGQTDPASWTWVSQQTCNKPARQFVLSHRRYAEAGTATASIEISRPWGSTTLAGAERAGGGSCMKRA